MSTDTMLLLSLLLLLICAGSATVLLVAERRDWGLRPQGWLLAVAITCWFLWLGTWIAILVRS